jgi:hypothetical protein
MTTEVSLNPGPRGKYFSLVATDFAIGSPHFGEPRVTISMLPAALAYAKRGLRVLPCKEADKSPLTTHGYLDASCDPEQIRAWWTRFPTALIGIVTGERFAVLDLDVKHGKNGLAYVPDWERRSPVIARTRSGGVHLYFAPEGAPHCTSDQIALGVDTRGIGGFVIAPPSAGYTWLNGNGLSFPLPLSQV